VSAAALALAAGGGEVWFRAVDVLSPAACGSPNALTGAARAGDITLLAQTKGVQQPLSM